MPGLRALLKKKSRIEEGAQPTQEESLQVPEFKIVRTTTESEEVIEPPSYPGSPQEEAVTPTASPKKQRERRQPGFRKSSNASITKDATARTELAVRPKAERRISDRLGFHRHTRSVSSDSSIHLPSDLPDAPATVTPMASARDASLGEKDVQEQREAQWEKRATLLAQGNPLLELQQQIQQQEQQQHRQQQQQEQNSRQHPSRPRSQSPSISDEHSDETIQEAIRLHETGNLTLSTAMFKRLGSPTGPNNALAQVLYGLALRHGWGVDPEPENAVHYLSLAASNSAAIEQAALESGLQRGGAAKGELVLAIFELANCFRHGWGVKKDAVAARQYYETAANLGDADAMEEAAWCFLEGFGGIKDKVCFLCFLYMPMARVAPGWRVHIRADVRCSSKRRSTFDSWSREDTRRWEMRGMCTDASWHTPAETLPFLDCKRY